MSGDSTEIDYRGILKKRAMPDEFLELRPSQRYSTTVDLSKAYQVPVGTKRIEIAFRHANHFSKDDFELYTPEPLVVTPSP